MRVKLLTAHVAVLPGLAVATRQRRSAHHDSCRLHFTPQPHWHVRCTLALLIGETSQRQRHCVAFMYNVLAMGMDRSPPRSPAFECIRSSLCSQLHLTQQSLLGPRIELALSLSPRNLERS